MVLEKWCHYTCPTQGCPKVLLCLKKKKKKSVSARHDKTRMPVQERNSGCGVFSVHPSRDSSSPSSSSKYEKVPCSDCHGWRLPTCPGWLQGSAQGDSHGCSPSLHPGAVAPAGEPFLQVLFWVTHADQC